MLSVIAISALGGLKTCTYSTADCSGTAVACVDNPDSGYDKCVKTGTGMSGKATCGGGSIKASYYAKEDCSGDVSAECATDGTEPNILTGGCSSTMKLDTCQGSMKISGSCPGGDDEPCFSREAEACRVLDTSVAPFAAFRACFDEPAPTVAERVKMTALTGGDYVLSAGKDQAYEFTRVIVNQHKLNEARHSHPQPPPPPWSHFCPSCCTPPRYPPWYPPHPPYPRAPLPH